jgi:hypothetical protein
MTIYSNTPLVKHFVSLWDTFFDRISQFKRHKTDKMMDTIFTESFHVK